MPSPYEDPAKSALRERCAIALDAAGHDVISDPARLAVPGDAVIKGGIKGDLQSVSSDGTRTVYCIRTSGRRAVPEWLTNWAAIAHKMAGVRLYVIVEESSLAMEQSCKACGAGLLVLTDDDTLEVAVTFGEEYDEARRASFKGKVTDLRRNLESKTSLSLKSLQVRHEQVAEITSGMKASARDKYIERIEAADVEWREWSEQASALIDEALASFDDQKLAQAVEFIGAPPSDDVEVG